MMINFRKCRIGLVAFVAFLGSACQAALDDNTQGSGEVSKLITGLCDAVARCDENLNATDCESELNDSAGDKIWDDLGLNGESISTSQVREEINDGNIEVNEASLDKCLEAMAETCDMEGESLEIDNYNNVDQLIEEEDACDSALIR